MTSACSVSLVAAHSWDIHGAASAGLFTAFLSADRPFSRALRKPDHKADTLPVLAEKLSDLS